MNNLHNKKIKIIRELLNNLIKELLN